MIAANTSKTIRLLDLIFHALSLADFLSNKPKKRSKNHCIGLYQMCKKFLSFLFPGITQDCLDLSNKLHFIIACRSVVPLFYRSFNKSMLSFAHSVASIGSL